jgi:hypothetical protein
MRITASIDSFVMGSYDRHERCQFRSRPSKKFGTP